MFTYSVILFWSFLWLLCIPTSHKQDVVKEKIVEKKNTAYKKTFIEKNTYADIDLFNLKGMGKIKNPGSYPYIKIESLRDQKKIIYKKSPKDSIERLYRKKNNYWVTSYLSKVDTGYFKTYEYITPKRIIEINYGGTWKKTDFYLSDISVHEKNRIIRYIINSSGKQKFNVQPGINILQDFKDKAEVILTEDYSISDSVLKILETRYDKYPKVVKYQDTSCYLTGGHSWFWWAYFYAKLVNCK